MIIYYSPKYKKCFTDETVSCDICNQEIDQMAISSWQYWQTGWTEYVTHHQCAKKIPKSTRHGSYRAVILSKSLPFDAIRIFDQTLKFASGRIGDIDNTKCRTIDRTVVSDRIHFNKQQVRSQDEIMMEIEEKDSMVRDFDTFFDEMKQAKIEQNEKMRLDKNAHHNPEQKTE